MKDSRLLAPSVRSRSFSRSIFLLLLILGALACDLGNLVKSAKPIAIITSPPSGSSFSDGDGVAVQSVSTDASGVVRVELLVDGQIVRTDTASSPQSQFLLIQIWQAVPGTHTIVVRAYDAQNNASNPAAISVLVAATSSTTPVTSAPAAPSATGNASPSPTECVNNAAFVADVTVPDGSLFSPNQSFNKIWRLRNNGTCAWGAGYQFVFISGDALTVNHVLAVPSTQPGATADFLVPMNAPSDVGSHVGNWRLKNPSGTLFGSVVTVKITVPGAASPTRQVLTPCNGAPNITSLTADAGLITWGATTILRWGAVTNADSVEIDPGIGGVAAGPNGDSTNISPTRSTIYTMTAHCGANIAQRQVTVLVPFAVTSVVGSVDPTSSNNCNQVFNFHFAISVNSAGTVNWRRERSDAAPDSAQGSYTFNDAGSFTADYAWQPNGPSGTNTFWFQLHTLSPIDVTSNQATFTLTCP